MKMIEDENEAKGT